jgi:hypothetical protein
MKSNLMVRRKRSRSTMISKSKFRLDSTDILLSLNNYTLLLTVKTNKTNKKIKILKTRNKIKTKKIIKIIMIIKK